MLEQYQKDRVELIKEILPYFGDNFVLKGGTALSLYYGLNRYSEDVDLDCTTNNMNFINKLKRHKDFGKWNINIKKDTDTVFRAMIDYGATSHYGSYPLKIEVSSRNKDLLRSNILKYENIKGVNVYSVDELIKMKGIAFSGRDKIRDFYDLGYLLQTYPDKFSKESLFSIREKIFYCGEDELNLLLKDENSKHKLISQDKIHITDTYTQDVLMRIENMLGHTIQNEITHSQGNNRESVLSRLGDAYAKKLESGAIKQPQISEKSKEKER
ncbi:nucleotidyl transferase AbiEii/AbiGii toxin family protein [Campylobacter hyointestinalis]|uniref:nucleotidyl transferase AbiEii/AbiGii toxin family protein n=1 Tax=Campylobacter hyointestinalis TaxID=198 RepID=UPI002023B258|nr:nucleotidyl transferase AbiEii/AbiGii toxin family protein [Campylobacter hyointestinalis]MDY2999661.1 nucleotidyl transferase AbiEii/AbiGii toxin family protein [Campylobacter hyointestinalis]